MIIIFCICTIFQILMNVLKILVTIFALILMAPLHVHVGMDMSQMIMEGVVMVCTYMCCYQLFILLYILCTDIDECLSGPCPSDLICNNVAGNYSCDCPDGTMRSGTECICKNQLVVYLCNTYIWYRINATSYLLTSLSTFARWVKQWYLNEP